MITIDELEQLAKAATPGRRCYCGPWSTPEYEYPTDCIRADAPGKPVILRLQPMQNYVDADRQFLIKAAVPETMLSLIADLRGATSYLNSIKDKAQLCVDTATQLGFDERAIEGFVVLRSLAEAALLGIEVKS